MLIAAASLIRVLFIPQYSTKEDKYEEEIRVLTDKLKEVCMKIRDNCYSVSAINSSHLTHFSLILYMSGVREPLVVRKGIAGGSWVGTFIINKLIKQYM